MKTRKVTQIHNTPVSAKLLSENGVRLVKDHKLYARLCAATDEIESVAEYLNGSCVDLCYSVMEADCLMKLAEAARATREEVDRWRTGKGMK